MPARPLTVVDCDGSPAAVRAVARALAAALDGSGPAVLPLPAGVAPERAPRHGRDPASSGPAGERDRLLATLRPDQPVDERVALVIATSGSTGEPKGVELPADALLASARATHERLGGPGRWLLALPVQHIAGAQVLVRSLLAGSEPVIMDLRGGFDPASFAAVARRPPPPDRWYTALVPTQLVRLLDAAGDTPNPGAGGDTPNPGVGGAALDALRGFDGVLIGGAACPPAVLARARAAGVAVVTTYGMTETAGGCVYDGRPLRGVRVRIGDGGRIEVAGPTLALGYRRNPAATAAAFDGGWFRTGDHGRLAADGTLEVLGRLDDVIVTGGRKVAPALVERALAAVPGVAQACVVGLPHPEWGELVAAAVVPTHPAEAETGPGARAMAGAEADAEAGTGAQAEAGAGADTDAEAGTGTQAQARARADAGMRAGATPPAESALRAAVRELAGPHAVPKHIRFLDALPQLGPGKVDRAALRRVMLERIAIDDDVTS